MQERLILIGYRGTGKTTVGRELARQLGWPFADADDELERQTGRSIAEIFRTDGEAAFRDVEEAILAELVQRRPLVLSTGGGAILRAANRQRLQQAGFVVWLRAEPQVIWDRLQQDASTGQRRPNLAQGGLAEVQELLAVRTPLYLATAHLEVDSTSRSPEDLAATILSAWSTAQSKPSD